METPSSGDGVFTKLDTKINTAPSTGLGHLRERQKRNRYLPRGDGDAQFLQFDIYALPFWFKIKNIMSQKKQDLLKIAYLQRMNHFMAGGGSR